MGATSIEWATHVWNPVTGCDRVSPGCAHCYALEFAARLKAMGTPQYQRDGGRASGPGFAVTCHPDRIEELHSWRKPRPRVFVNSMSDLFHPDVPDGFIAWCWYAMSQRWDSNFLILTKRPDRMRDFAKRWEDSLERDDQGELVGLDFVGARGPEAVREHHKAGRALLFADMLEQWGEPPAGAAYPTYDWMEGVGRWPAVAENIWLGVSIENRRFVDRADILRDTPAAVRFISAEPLLGPLAADLDLTGMDWVIAGGESGARHRPVREEWVRDLRDACIPAAVAFFFKQWGGRTPKAGGRELDGRTWDQFPAHHFAEAAVA